MLEPILKVLKRQDIKFEYRKSNIGKGNIILGAKFLKERGNQSDISDEIDGYKTSRINTQPVNAMTAGRIKPC